MGGLLSALIGGFVGSMLLNRDSLWTGDYNMKGVTLGGFVGTMFETVILPFAFIFAGAFSLHVFKVVPTTGSRLG